MMFRSIYDNMSKDYQPFGKFSHQLLIIALLTIIPSVVGIIVSWLTWAYTLEFIYVPISVVGLVCAGLSWVFFNQGFDYQEEKLFGRK